MFAVFSHSFAVAYSWGGAVSMQPFVGTATIGTSFDIAGSVTIGGSNTVVFTGAGGWTGQFLHTTTSLISTFRLTAAQ